MVLNRQRAHAVKREELVDFLHQLIRAMPARRADSLGVSLVSDRKMREYNRTFRGKAGATDVLSFPSDPEPDPSGHRHLGDIVVSVTTAERQARSVRHSLSREIKALLLHGYLHLLGYDHETDDGTMMELQRELSARLLARRAGGRTA